MRRFAPPILLALACTFAAASCATYRQDLDRARAHYDANEYLPALALLRVLERDLDSFSPEQQAQYAYTRGMTDYRLAGLANTGTTASDSKQSFRDNARHWLGVSAAIEQTTPGSLTGDVKQRLDEALADLNHEVYGGADLTADADAGGAHREALKGHRQSSARVAVFRRFAPYAPALLASSALGLAATRSILALTREPAVPLDDAFIHFQYARRLAEGSFFGYAPGAGYTSGATSFLWPLLLAPFHALGARGLALIYVAWVLGTLAHAALAVETYRLALPLAGRAAAVFAGAMSALFGAFAWFGWSGMETVPFAWILMRSGARRGFVLRTLGELARGRRR